MRLVILWHFHQPVYRRPGTCTFALPWVNYHLKNYHQMVRIAEETGYPCTFNLAPCLVEQILDYAEGRADDAVQRALEKPAGSLSGADIESLRPFAPGEDDPARIQTVALASFLSPVDPIPDTKEALLERQAAVLAGLIPAFRRLWHEDRIEITATPYYHPLTPLLCDLEAASGHDLPAIPFRRPEDARRHLAMAFAYVEEVFGRTPAGLWPSEGGLSPAVASIAAQTGFPFAVTDENVLWKSLGGAPDPARLLTPYRSEGLPVFFRDRELSDLIGFTYQHGDAVEAADDLVRRIRQRSVCSPEGTLVLALDGENPWGTYRENGVPFLRSLFERLGDVDGLRPSFFGEALESSGLLPEVDLAPGTWLGSFAKWIGDPAKNAGWETLARAREDCGPIEEILVAEGSDWFWWFGEGHPEFDALFHEYIRAAYAAAGKTPPGRGLGEG